jgi:SAM-dependent methyltransferase
VIEHVADTAGWLSELRRVLRSGGTLLLSTPDHGRLQMLRWALDRRAFEAHFDPRADHLRFYTRRTLTALIEDFGFQDVEVRHAGGPHGARRALLASARRSRF